MIVKIYQSLSSTNKKAKELVKKGAQAWTVILAKEQRGGYGRKGESWFSPKGGLYFSIILPRLKIDDLEILTNLTAFSIAKVLKEYFLTKRVDLEPLIKLPNDIYLNGKKISGILVENVVGQEVKFSIMGIGLNTNIKKFPEELKDKATSLAIELAEEVDQEKIFQEILRELKNQIRVVINQ